MWGKWGWENLLLLTSGVSWVQLFIDQYGGRLFKFCQGRNVAHIYEAEFAGNISPLSLLLPKLAKRGISKLDGNVDLLAEIRTLNTPTGTLRVAKRPGWVAESSFAYPTGTVCTSGRRSQDAIVTFPLQPKFRSLGTKTAWSEGLRPHIEGNTILQFLVCLGLTPVLLRPFSRKLDLQNNIGFQINGPSSIGKTTGARLAGSMWGGDPDEGGNFIDTWLTTMAGLETKMQFHSDALLVLDEANLAGSTPAERAKFQTAAVFMLDTGGPRGRFGEADSSLTRLTVISTSNAPLAGTSSDDRVDAALQVRMPSLDIGIRPHGILDRPGETGAAATIAAVEAIIRTNYGWAAPAFIQAVTLRRRQCEVALLRSLSDAAQEFKQAADFDALSPQQQRLCKTFSFIYATGRLAAATRSIPLTTEQALSATLSVYREVTCGMGVGADDLISRFEAALGTQRSALADLSLPVTSDLSDDSGVLGYIRNSGSNGVELFVAPGAGAHQLGLTKAILHALRDAGALVVDGRHLTTTRTGIQGRVHVIRLDPKRFPGQLSVLQPSVVVPFPRRN